VIRTFVKHASALVPSMFIAQDPQMPSLQCRTLWLSFQHSTLESPGQHQDSKRQLVHSTGLI